MFIRRQKRKRNEMGSKAGSSGQKNLVPVFYGQDRFKNIVRLGVGQMREITEANEATSG